MAEFKEVLRQRKRMCKYENNCGNCKLAELNNGKRRLCRDFVLEYAENAEKIIMKWAAEHPEKTLADVFFERNPEAPKSPWNTPMMCPHYIGLADRPKECETSEESSARDCVECWNRSYEK